MSNDVSKDPSAILEKTAINMRKEKIKDAQVKLATGFSQETIDKLKKQALIFISISKDQQYN